MQILHLQLKLIKNYAMIKLSNSIGGVFYETQENGIKAYVIWRAE